MKLKVGDNVKVISGKDKGMIAKVTRVHPTLDKVEVEGVNIVKRHTKPSQTNQAGGIIEKTLPIWASKVALVHPDDKKKTSRVGYEVSKSGKKQRVYRQANNKVVK